MKKLSVCTIYANRRSHLINLVKGLSASATKFSELVIVAMGDLLPQLPSSPFAIKTATIDCDSGLLPLAAARNKCAEIATEEKLVFLDIDCIASPNLVDIFNYHLEKEDALYQGCVGYLNANWQQNRWTYDTLQQQSQPNQLQGKPVSNFEKRLHSYELFWSLCFAIRKKTFWQLGGFDSDYLGYGGEDTDFSLTARAHKLPLYKVSALAYHQFHPSFNPPLNHLVAIVSNARIFARKWDVLPMQKWLRQFADLGYIELNNREIKIIRYPTEKEIQACIKQY